MCTAQIQSARAEVERCGVTQAALFKEARRVIRAALTAAPGAESASKSQPDPLPAPASEAQEAPAEVDAALVQGVDCSSKKAAEYSVGLVFLLRWLQLHGQASAAGRYLPVCTGWRMYACMCGRIYSRLKQQVPSVPAACHVSGLHTAVWVLILVDTAMATVRCARRPSQDGCFAKLRTCHPAWIVRLAACQGRCLDRDVRDAQVPGFVTGILSSHSFSRMHMCTMHPKVVIVLPLLSSSA